MPSLRCVVAAGAVLALAAAACTRPAPEATTIQAAEPAPPTSAPPAASAPPPVASASASASAPVAPPPPEVHVKIVTIGMHVGGGPYDEITKEPIKRSVEPHFKELAQCWRHVAEPRQADVGVDLVIEAAGGKAKVSNPRTTAAGEGFVPCVVAFYEHVDFQKPRNGRTVVSYSVRFTP